jgi:hypothetical protein
MTGEFEKQISQRNLERDEVKEILAIIGSAGEEFPCLSCPSKGDCNTYKWFIKWFGEWILPEAHSQN